MATYPDPEPRSTTDDTSESEQLSRIKRYDQRVEEWLTSLKDEAGQRSPEVLGALAAKAQDVADYLNKMAERARSKGVASDDAPSAGNTSRSDVSASVGDSDVGSGLT